jgi:pantoate--beta-alanine ligase
MKLVESVRDLQEQLDKARGLGQRIVFVPTMGALHEGHLSLVDEANKVQDAFVVVSIFVNPAQFGKGEDFDRYPRTLESDLDALSKASLAPAVVFVPSVQEVYPDGMKPPFKLRAGALGSVFEGAARPGHFDGMLHIVSWFFELIKPEVAIFGEKDAQQVFLIKRMLHREFNDSIEILEAQTVRESDFLAKSSRNRFLSEKAREFAPLIFATMVEVSENIVEGLAIAESLSLGRSALDQPPLAKLDYLALVDKSNFSPIGDKFEGEAQMIVAVVVDGVRLIDNLTFYIQEPA